MSKKNESEIGLINKKMLSVLTSSLSIVKGMLATLELKHHSLWTKKLRRTPPEHLRILLLEATEEICTAEKALERLSI